MQFKDIFAEYYSIVLGQSTSIPGTSNREFINAVYLCNNAIRTWDRVDGQLWRELIATFADELVVDPTVGGDILIAANKTSYAAVGNMRKPPSFVRLFSGGTYDDVPVVPVQQAENMTSNDVGVYFTGSANAGYTMHIGPQLAAQRAGWSIDYVYVRKPRLLPTAADKMNEAAEVYIDMSDPNFAIHSMVAAKAANARNGFLFKTSNAAATTALLNMKIEDSSGTHNASDRLALDRGWGVNSGIDARIKL